MDDALRPRFEAEIQTLEGSPSSPSRWQCQSVSLLDRNRGLGGHPVTGHGHFSDANWRSPR